MNDGADQEAVPAVAGGPAEPSIKEQVLDQMGGSEPMAAASYNAGPGRARAWRADVPLEGAIYAESIPFNETRDYVKKVLANAVWYAHLQGSGNTSLKSRLGIIPAR